MGHYGNQSGESIKRRETADTYSKLPGEKKQGPIPIDARFITRHP